MNPSRYKKRTAAAFLFVMLALIMYLIGGTGSFAAIGVSLLLGVTLAILLTVIRSSGRLRAVADPSAAPGVNPLIRTIENEANENVSGATVDMLGTEYRREQHKETEKSIDRILDEGIKLIQAKLDAHTIAIFFPSSDGGYQIRRFVSRCGYINQEAVIYPGVGVIGSFLKDGLKQLNLEDIITDSMTLYYYTKDAGIRSLMASPIVAGGVERGTVIVDSTEKKHFSVEDHTFLSTVASLLGQTVYFTYMYTEHQLSHQRFSAMSKIENDFFKHPTMDAILDRMIEIIPYAIGCDRLSISLKSDDGEHGVIRRVWGQHTESLLSAAFDLNERSLVGLVYAKNICLMRDFSDQRYEIRYGVNEPAVKNFASFIAFPLGVDQCNGAVLIESLRKDAFTESHRDLLTRLATSAGLAIEKIRLYDRANSLATHDGLTGLFNHRQFQSLLKDEVARAARYNDPLALIIGDIDFFKKLNDTYGHPFGDVVLKGVAEKLSESIRVNIDIAARYGGEEFALILVKTDAANAQETAERIRQTIAKAVFQSGRGEEVRITMSFGIAAYGEHAREPNALIKKADKALYRAKENGRNRVELF